MSSIYHLLYSSTASSYISKKMVEEVLDVSRRYNALNKVTGLLICRSGHFLQLLEGTRESVRQTYERIKLDRRHEATFILAEFQSEARIFPEWNMGHIEDTKNSYFLSKELNTFLKSPVAMDENAKTKVLSVLKSLAKAKA
jgi:hypothetical protein